MMSVAGCPICMLSVPWQLDIRKEMEGTSDDIHVERKRRRRRRERVRRRRKRGEKICRRGESGVFGNACNGDGEKEEWSSSRPSPYFMSSAAGLPRRPAAAATERPRRPRLGEDAAWPRGRRGTSSSRAPRHFGNRNMSMCGPQRGDARRIRNAGVSWNVSRLCGSRFGLPRRSARRAGGI